MSSRSFEKPIRIPGKQIAITKKMIEDSQAVTKSNSAAARWLGVHYLTYRKYAKIYEEAIEYCDRVSWIDPRGNYWSEFGDGMTVPLQQEITVVAADTLEIKKIFTKTKTIIFK